ncbi:MAG TPA: hypothetical protein VI942_09520, partial [Thermoanaerobaculia bacterium]|nr:hypothetical protein [Thermoanaerobaculia bacterium]
LAIEPSAPERLLAGTWRRAFRSDDGGASWRGVFDGMVLDTEVFSLEPVPGRAGELWASTCGWVYRGERFGESWRRHQAGLTERRTPALAVISPERLLAGTVAGVFLSDDGGTSFRRTSDPSLAVLALAHHPAEPARILMGTDGAGIWRSEDGGESFAPASIGLASGRVSAVVAEGGSLYAALSFAGPLSGVYRSRDAGASFERLAALPASVTGLAVGDGELLAATEDGLFVFTTDGWLPAPGIAAGRVDGLERGGEGWTVSAGGRRYLWRGGRLAASTPSAAAVATGAAHDAERRLGTGDARFPALRIAPDGARLAMAGGAAPLALPFPHQSVLAAAVDGERLLLATSGFGLRTAPLPAAAAGAASGALERIEDPEVGGEALGSDGLAPHGVADRAPGLVPVAAIRESAVGSERLELVEVSGELARRQAPESELANTGRIDDARAVGQPVDPRAGRRVASPLRF